MQMWEYKVIGSPANNEEGKERVLNRLGAVGWELVCIDADDWYIFKRPVEEELSGFEQEVARAVMPEWREVTTGVPEYNV